MSTLFDLPAFGYLDREDVMWRLGEAWEANVLLSRHHYLGPLHSGARLTIIGARGGEPVAAMMWKHPTSRNLPSTGSWLELSRWCLTADAGENAGSRMHKWAVRLIRDHLPAVTTLVSYSDPAHGHTGALYRACNWQWAPTWHRLRTPPSGNGDWGTGPQAVKDRWVFCVRSDSARNDALAVDDPAAVRHWQANATEQERRWASRSLNMRSVDVERTDLVPRDGSDVVTSRPAVNEIADVQMGLPDVPDADILAVHGDAQPLQAVKQVRRVGFTPIEFHASGPAFELFDHIAVSRTDENSNRARPVCGQPEGGRLFAVEGDQIVEHRGDVFVQPDIQRSVHVTQCTTPHDVATRFVRQTTARPAVQGEGDA